MPKKEKSISLPTDAGKVEPKPLSLNIGQHFKKEVEKFVDALLASEWQPYCARPRCDLHGHYVIFQWVTKEKSWVPLFADVGPVSNHLNKIFCGKRVQPISKYVTSFPKDQRKLIWIKWQQFDLDKELPELDEVLKVLAMKYNNGERPAFNFEKEDKQVLPSNFSILG